ncbi:MAG: amidohydrolase family protein [Actinomycetota bacterium]|nr:amidohydrolase family protein [Actinomycetota bacterium]
MVAVVDTHQHFWPLGGAGPPPVAGEQEPLRRDFLPDDLRPELAAAGVDATVLVQAVNSVRETEAMLGLAGDTGFVAGVVGWVPLSDPRRAEAALERYRGQPAFKGVRHLPEAGGDPDWLLAPPVTESLALVADAGATLDVVAAGPDDLRRVITLVERLPQLEVVVDHLGTPPVPEGGWEPWASLLRSVASHSGACAKVSAGVAVLSRWPRWSADELRPYVDHALDCLGPDRLMFASNWPVALLAGDYQRVWAGTNAVLAGLSPPERAAVLGGTAARVYRLDT